MFVLMDIMIPAMAGYEAIHKIGAQMNPGKLRVLALISNAMEGDRQKCIDAGANDYLVKPN